MRTRGLVLAAVGLAVLVALFIALRPSSEPTAEPSGQGVSPSGAPPSAPAASETPSAAPSAEAAEIEIEVEDGQVDGPGEASVTVGDEVVLRVTADVADEVHLHGYDLHVDLEPGVPGELRFTADAPGVFEVELEDAGLRILSLTVEP